MNALSRAVGKRADTSVDQPLVTSSTGEVEYRRLMSKYEQFRIGPLKDYPLDSRPSKVERKDFAHPLADLNIGSLRRCFPRILAAEDLLDLVDRLIEARRRKRAIIWGYGGHVIKVGLAPVLIDLMGRGFVTALATNGAGIIHDFEIGWAGKTSEDVDLALPAGEFGMARETGQYLNRAISEGVDRGLGIGESVGEFLATSKARYPQDCLVLQAYRRDIPCSVHVAMGTDIIHYHPDAQGKAFGEGSMIDFRILTHQVESLDDGGVFLNIGSAVILPEIFLKAVTLIRNAGSRLEDFTTANLDFIQHYRPRMNVLTRPVSGSGRGIALTGHHEIMVPLLAALLIERSENR